MPSFLMPDARIPCLRTCRARRTWLLLLTLSFVLGIARSQAQDQPSSQPPSDNSQQTPPQENQTPPQQNPAQQNPQTSRAPQQQQPTQPQSPAPGKKDDNPAAQVADATKKLGEETLNKVRDWEAGWFTGPYISRSRQPVALTGQQRRDIYLQQTLTTPSAYFKRMFSAGVDQIRESPSQWNEHWSGYGERFASREGQFITANSLAALGNAALKYEPRYDQCHCSGFWPRTRHAILRNFLTYDESELHMRPQWALYGGAFAGGVIATSWKPHPRNALANGGFAALEQGGYGAALNFFIEFAGEINRKLGGRDRK